MADLIDRIELMRQIAEFGREIPKDQVIGVIARQEAVEVEDRPRGRWHYSDGKPATIGQSFGVICDQCGTESEYCTNFCGECGADMRGRRED